MHSETSKGREKKKKKKWEEVFVSCRCAFCTLCKRIKNWDSPCSTSQTVGRSSSLIGRHISELECRALYKTHGSVFISSVVSPGCRLGNFLNATADRLLWSRITLEGLVFLFSFVFFFFSFVVARVALLTELYKYSTWPVHGWVQCSIKLGILLPPAAFICGSELQPASWHNFYNYTTFL